jgi:hypothetical protein
LSVARNISSEVKLFGFEHLHTGFDFSILDNFGNQKMKVSIDLKGSEVLLAHKETIEAVVGPIELTNVEKLTVNYNIELTSNADMFDRVHALVNLSEVCESIDVDVDSNSLNKYCESIRLLNDLVSISKNKKEAELWIDRDEDIEENG